MLQKFPYIPVISLAVLFLCMLFNLCTYVRHHDLANHMLVEVKNLHIKRNAQLSNIELTT